MNDWPICVSKITTIGSDNGLSLGRRKAIIWTNAGVLLIEPFSEILIEIYTFSFKKMHLKTSSAKRRPFCLGLIVFTVLYHFIYVIWFLIEWWPPHWNISMEIFLSRHFWITPLIGILRVTSQWFVQYIRDQQIVTKVPAILWFGTSCATSNGSWCIGIKGEMSGTVCVTFTWDIYIYMSCL